MRSETIDEYKVLAFLAELTARSSVIAEPTVIEAASMTIGDTDGWHMVIDGRGQRIYDGEMLLKSWPLAPS